MSDGLQDALAREMRELRAELDAVRADIAAIAAALRNDAKPRKSRLPAAPRVDAGAKVRMFRTR